MEEVLLKVDLFLKFGDEEVLDVVEGTPERSEVDFFAEVGRGRSLVIPVGEE